jgi:hypothetical protein
MLLLPLLVMIDNLLEDLLLAPLYIILVLIFLNLDAPLFLLLNNLLSLDKDVVPLTNPPLSIENLDNEVNPDEAADFIERRLRSNPDIFITPAVDKS